MHSKRDRLSIQPWTAIWIRLSVFAWQLIGLGVLRRTVCACVARLSAFSASPNMSSDRHCSTRGLSSMPRTYSTCNPTGVKLCASCTAMDWTCICTRRCTACHALARVRPYEAQVVLMHCMRAKLLHVRSGRVDCTDCAVALHACKSLVRAQWDSGLQARCVLHTSCSGT